ncbi:type II/IV secretion system protein [Candidatus Falkowbacteria bacterium]|jgi:type IV pilus assembly protein PilB|nr:type II/IV secretion system protein [Candidatus Falkowbacteria bacterium]MBT7007575.1 type II/IV secretion system protein [Candidatus Falkowbacteria bacterium]
MTNSASIEDLLNEDSKQKISKEPKQKKTDDKKTSSGSQLSQKLKDVDIKDNEAKVAAKAAVLQLPYIDLAIFPVSGDALQTIPENICKKNNVVCFVNTGEQIRLATTDPKNPEIEKMTHALAEAHHAKVELYFMSKRSLEKALEIYNKLPKYRKPAPGLEITEADLEKFKEIATDLKKLEENIQKVDITELVSLIVASAMQARSSDIHIEAEEKDVKIRFRIDGVLHDSAAINKDRWEKIISRIKLLAKLKVNINDKPQDGRFTILTKKEKIDVRVSTLPTNWGESVVMRLLGYSAASLTFESLGLVGQSFEKLKAQTERPNGMIITTGPTGSGKTTTLYAILSKLNAEGTKIITLEDPIEYKVEGLNQSQIDHSKGYTFVDGLRSILRQDPDVVMVGELRDTETSQVAINAALTGHLVISTLHTNDASGAIPRFLAMDVKPFLLAPSLNAVIGQRLVRRVCEDCKEEVALDETQTSKVKKILEAIPEDHPDRPDLNSLKFFHGKGCDSCNGLGLKGRVGIYEIMIMDKQIEELIQQEKVSEYDMKEIAIKNGMITMVQDGLIKSLQGITTVDEVFRVSE